MVVPYAAGGTTDQIARLIGQKLSEQWGQNVFADFHPGGGTVIGASIVANAPADGYTWLLTVNTNVINEHLMAKLPYWRRERDSNPRYGLTRIHAFQACAFNRSATSPAD